MRPKAVASVVLLAFVMASVAYLIAKEVGRGPGPESRAEEARGDAQSEPPRDVGSAASSAPSSAPSRAQRTVTAYYFHGNVRCANCRKIEAWTQSALRDGFPEDLRQDRLAWSPVNVDQSGNEHFIRDFMLYTRSVVLAGFQDGRIRRHKNLQEIWQFLGNRKAFEEYIKQEVSLFLREHTSG